MADEESKDFYGVSTEVVLPDSKVKGTLLEDKVKLFYQILILVKIDSLVNT